MRGDSVCLNWVAQGDGIQDGGSPVCGDGDSPDLEEAGSC